MNWVVAYKTDRDCDEQSESKRVPLFSSYKVSKLQPEWIIFSKKQTPNFSTEQILKMHPAFCGGERRVGDLVVLHCFWREQSAAFSCVLF